MVHLVSVYKPRGLLPLLPKEREVSLQVIMDAKAILPERAPRVRKITYEVGR